ncbi:hypothetical protein NE865_00459 [Phthorimaea operculella]|nr:hypothetical protein NE865_00459 [Phthorimaea operculella]
MDFLRRRALVFVVLTLCHHCCSSMRHKRDNSDHFNVMLSLFKVKPLGRSRVYKTFSNTMLLPPSDPIRLSDIKFNDKEFNEYIKNEQKQRNDSKDKDYPVIKKELEEEPIKENNIDYDTEPRFEAVDKLEVFEDLSPRKAKFNTIDDLNIPEFSFRTLNAPSLKKKKLKQKHLSDAEVFIPEFYSRDRTKRYFRVIWPTAPDKHRKSKKYIHP